MKNTKQLIFIILIIISILQSCCIDNQLERILPLLEVTDATVIDSTEIIDKAEIIVKIVNMPDFNKQEVGCDYYVQGTARENTLAIKALFREDENNDWQYVQFGVDTGMVDFISKIIPTLEYGNNSQHELNFQMETSGMYKFEFYPDYYDEILERDEINTEKKTLIPKSIIIIINEESTNSNNPIIILNK